MTVAVEEGRLGVKLAAAEVGQSPSQTLLSGQSLSQCLHSYQFVLEASHNLLPTGLHLLVKPGLDVVDLGHAVSCVVCTNVIESVELDLQVEKQLFCLLSCQFIKNQLPITYYTAVGEIS